MEVRDAAPEYAPQVEMPVVQEGYKQTEVGVIPEDWEVLRLGDLGDFLKGQGVKRSESATGNIPCVRYGEIYTHHNDIVRRFISRISREVAQSAKRLRTGDILFAGSGETKAEIGKAVAFVDENEAYAGGDIVIFRQQSADSRFLGYVLNAPLAARQKSSKGQGDAVVHISSTALACVQIPLPPKEEQHSIATALSDVDALLEALDRLIAKKRDIKQATMQQLLTAQTRLPGFEEQWELKQLDELADMDPENLDSSTHPAYAFNYIALDDVNIGKLESHSEITFSSAPSRARRKLRNGDILMATVRPNLKAHLHFNKLKGEWVCSTGFCVIRCRKDVSHSGFLFQHLFAHPINKQVEALIAGSNYPAISNKDVRELEIPTPPFEEQVAISGVLSEMDAELEILQHRHAKAAALKQAMMQELLTGRTRLVSGEFANG